MGAVKRVRTAAGLVEWKNLEDHGFSLLLIKEWRRIEHDAGRPSSLDDSFIQHGLCANCRGQGVKMIGWSDPAPDEVAGAVELGLEQLPLYEICRQCGGSALVIRER